MTRKKGPSGFSKVVTLALVAMVVILAAAYGAGYVSWTKQISDLNGRVDDLQNQTKKPASPPAPKESATAHYEFSLVNTTDVNGVVVDQMIKRVNTDTKETLIVVASVQKELPGMVNQALYEFARPKNADLIVFSIGPRGDSDFNPLWGKLVAFDTKKLVFVPRLADVPWNRVLSPDQHHLVAVIESGNEGVGLYLYDLVTDRMTTLVTLSGDETLVKGTYALGPPEIDVSWKDNETVSYAVFSKRSKFSTSGAAPVYRKALDTRTITITP